MAPGADASLGGSLEAAVSGMIDAPPNAPATGAVAVTVSSNTLSELPSGKLESADPGSAENSISGSEEPLRTSAPANDTSPDSDTGHRGGVNNLSKTSSQRL